MIARSIRLLAAPVVCGLVLGSLSAAPAVARTQTAAATRTDPQAAALYRQLLQAHGVEQSVSKVVADARRATLDAVKQHKGAAFTPQDQARLDDLAAAAFDPLVERILDMIATEQAGVFTTAEIRTLIAAESSPVNAAYVASAATDAQGYAEGLQTLMVDAVVEIVQAYQNSTTLADLPGFTSSGSAFDDRMALAIRLMSADGSEEAMRHTLTATRMPLIVNEVGNYVNFSGLTEADSNRLVILIRQAGQRLGARLLRVDARRHATALTEAQLTALIAARDTEAQRKLASVQTSSSADVDRKAGEMLQAATAQITAAFGIEQE